MPNVTDHGYYGGSEHDRTHVLPNVIDEEDAELLEAMLRRHTDPSMFFKKGMESLKKAAEEPLCTMSLRVVPKSSRRSDLC
jgi:hypothetical protein